MKFTIEIEVDTNKLSESTDCDVNDVDSIKSAIEREMGWVEQSGIAVSSIEQIEE